MEKVHCGAIIEFMKQKIYIFFTLFLIFYYYYYYTGEQEFTARNAGMSSVIVFSLMIPLLFLMIIMCSRYVQRKNLEEEALEKEIYLAELEQQRKRVFDLLYKDHQREAEIELFLEQQEKAEELHKIRPMHLSLKVVHEADKTSDAISATNYDQYSTDDELFELPLPPIPSTSKTKETFNSDDDNPSNLSFSISPRQYRKFPPSLNFPPPPPPPLPSSQSPSPPPLPDLFSKGTSFDPLVLPPVPLRLSTPTSPISKVLSTNSSFNDTQKPKKFMQSDF